MRRRASVKIISRGPLGNPYPSGIAYATAAYLFWGFAPVYFVWVAFASPLEVLAHRVVWSIPLLALLVTLARQWPMVLALQRRALGTLVVCSMLLSINWATFVFAVQHGRIAETALGYFINPLVSIALGAVFLKERLRGWQWSAVGIAAVGVGMELVLQRQLPWYGLLLAGSFGCYGLLRRKLGIASVVGLAVEAACVAPLAIAYLFWLGGSGIGEPRSIEQLFYLGLGGAVTVTPLIWFASAAVRLPLSSLGFFQYIAPSLSLLLAIVVYDEVVSATRWFSFAMIWLALLLMSVESLVYGWRRGRVSNP